MTIGEDLKKDIDPLEEMFERETTHTVCCRDDKVGLCKVTIDNFEPLDGTEIVCDLCTFLETTEYCPRGLICPIIEDDEEP